MSAPARADWNSNRAKTTAEMVFPAAGMETAMRERVNVVRDTIIVLGIQIVFRVMLHLRRWNF